MLKNIIILQASSKSQLDSIFQSLEKIPPETLLSFNNPIFFSLFIIIVILSVTIIYYRFVVVPLKIKFVEEKQALQIQQSEMMAMFSELSPDPVIRCDVSGKILLANESSNELFRKRVLIGQFIENVFPEIKRFDIRGLIKNNVKKSFVNEIDGKSVQFIISGISRYNSCQIYGRDISELKRTQEDLKVALTKAEASTKLKEEFLSRISHEIRSPLVAIQGYSDLLKAQSDDFGAEYKEIFESIENNSKRLYRTVELILNMSQVQTDSYECTFKEINIYNIIERIYREFASFGSEKGIEFNINSEIGNQLYVYADDYSVSQIFVNLVDNAFKYTKEGKIEIFFLRINGFIKVVVMDTGVGISEKYQTNLFQPFSQEYSGYTRPYDGAGLGLALVKSFVDLNDAKIEVESEIDRGTKFIVSFKEVLNT